MQQNYSLPIKMYTSVSLWTKFKVISVIKITLYKHELMKLKLWMDFMFQTFRLNLHSAHTIVVENWYEMLTILRILVQILQHEC